MRWTDIVEGILFVLVLHELFLRSRFESIGQGSQFGMAVYNHPIKPDFLRILGGNTGLLPEPYVKGLIVLMMVALVIVTHSASDKVGAAQAMSCGSMGMSHGSHAMSKKRMVVSHSRSDAQGRPDSDHMIME